MDRVFFANSGEANEAALKIWRAYMPAPWPEQSSCDCHENSFHGRTLTVSATANPTAREGFFTLDDDFAYSFGDIDAIKQVSMTIAISVL